MASFGPRDVGCVPRRAIDRHPVCLANFPVDHSWTRYNGLQQLSYFITVFIATPVSIATGLVQSPAISNG